MRYIAESGFGLACNSLFALIATVALFGAPPAMAAAPTISGTPPSSVIAGSKYWFRPSARDADGNTLYFSISNKPSWAWFSTSTGSIGGTPASAQVGTYGNIVIRVSDGRSTRSLPAFSIAVRSSGTSSTGAPRISGSPPASVAVGGSYSFKPTVSDPNGDKLTFTIVNKPVWATFSTITGQFAGVPSSAHVGTYSNIVIKVTDGKTWTSLPAFSINVTQTGSGSATVSWLPPTTNTNGSSLSNLAGYRISYGTSSTSLTRTVQVANPGLSRYVISNLSAGTWYFGVRAYTSSGSESALSRLATKTVK